MKTEKETAPEPIRACGDYRIGGHLLKVAIAAILINDPDPNFM